MKFQALIMLNGNENVGGKTFFLRTMTTSLIFVKVKKNEWKNSCTRAVVYA